jgi:galactitol-specific phosphotransferase system IIB component
VLVQSAVSQNSRAFVQAANIAGLLHFAVKQARELSLTAKNARVIAVRAGDKAAGFKAITDFIDRLAVSTIEQAVEINAIAIKLSRLSVEMARVEELLETYQTVQQRSRQSLHVASLVRPYNALQQQLDVLQLQFKRLRNELVFAITETRREVRSADIIATTSKVEASLAAEFKAPLEVIANNIEETSGQIKTYLERALAQINQ